MASARRTPPSGKELLAAIRTNSTTVVRSYLQRGASANASLPLPRWDDLDDTTDDDGRTKDVTGLFAVNVSQRSPSLFTPLHAAVLNCYQSYDEGDSYSKKGVQSLQIVKHLLNAGAESRPGNSRGTLRLINIGYNDSSGRQSYLYITAPASATPIGLAMYLKKHPKGFDPAKCRAVLDKCIVLLTEAEDALVAATHTDPKLGPKMVRVPKSTLTLWKGMLFSNRFSDIVFICDSFDDDTGETTAVRIPAHQNILAHASEYFDVLFSDRWREQHEDGELVTSNSVGIVRAMLRFIYTGSIDPQMLEEDALNLLSVAGEYMLPALRKLAEQSCIRRLDASNVKQLLLLADVHGASVLKRSCFVYVKRNASAVLTNPAMMALAAENAELWQELCEAIGGDTSGGGGGGGGAAAASGGGRSGGQRSSSSSSSSSSGAGGSRPTKRARRGGNT